MKLFETFNPNKQAVAFGVKKKPKDTAPIWFKEFEKKMNATLGDIKTRLTNVENRIETIEDKLVRNNIN